MTIDWNAVRAALFAPTPLITGPSYVILRDASGVHLRLVNWP